MNFSYQNHIGDITEMVASYFDLINYSSSELYSLSISFLANKYLGNCCFKIKFDQIDANNLDIKANKKSMF